LQPWEVEDFLKQEEDWVPQRHLPKKHQQAGARQLPRVIFQESIATLIRRRTGLSFDETYRFLQMSARGSMSDMQPLWSMAVEGARRRNFTDYEANLALKGLAEASQWAVCKAHHAANAITSYKAAYYRTHYRAEFEEAVRRVMSLN
jgi:DNA polymerase III alpha subunit